MFEKTTPKNLILIVNLQIATICAQHALRYLVVTGKYIMFLLMFQVAIYNLFIFVYIVDHHNLKVEGKLKKPKDIIINQA